VAQQDDLRTLLNNIALHGARYSLFGIDLGLRWKTKQQVKAIEREITRLDRAALAVNLVKANAYISQISRELVAGEVELERIEQAKVSQEAKNAREAAKQAKRDVDALLAAQVRGTIRANSASLRAKLRRDHPCPYCFGPLGLDPHADHIHPVSKGGLAVITNYVFACRPCNQAKRDLSLTQFIDQMGFDLNSVLRALRSLGKDV